MLETYKVGQKLKRKYGNKDTVKIVGFKDHYVLILDMDIVHSIDFDKIENNFETIEESQSKGR